MSRKELQVSFVLFITSHEVSMLSFSLPRCIYFPFFLPFIMFVTQALAKQYGIKANGKVPIHNILAMHTSVTTARTIVWPRCT